MRLCLFDDVSGGHHTSYMRNLTMTALARGIEVYAASPEPPGADHWIQTPGTPHREVLAGLRTAHRVAQWCRREGIDVILNLYLDKTIWSWTRGMEGSIPTVHVLHHAHQYGDRASAMSRARSRLARRRLEGWTAGGDTVIVHTPQAFETMKIVVPESRLRLLGYPILTHSSHVHRVNGQGAELVFAGYARAEKGLQHAIEALRWLPPEVTLTVVGRQDPTTRAALESTRDTSRIRWIDRPVDDEEYANRLCGATLAILPYEEAFGRKGGASGVLLEALAHGTPLVTTTALAPQLPPGYRGAVVVEPEYPRALADGIAYALQHADVLRKAAQETGPDFVTVHHSFGRYLDGLLERT